MGGIWAMRHVWAGTGNSGVLKETVLHWTTCKRSCHVLLLEHDKVIMNRISAEKGCLVWDGQLKQP